MVRVCSLLYVTIRGGSGTSKMELLFYEYKFTAENKQKKTFTRDPGT